MQLRIAYITIILLGLTAKISQAQDKHTLSGTITDAGTGEALIGAAIYITALQKGAITNTYGFYSITFSSQDSVSVVFSYVGY
nr:carboxypeptidase-like regulatory domain-containing protein [Cyclobacteriaceae bacterium]